MLIEQAGDGVPRPTAKTAFGRHAEPGDNLLGRRDSAPGAFDATGLVHQPQEQLRRRRKVQGI